MNQETKPNPHKEGILNQILTYFYLRKRNPHAPRNINIFLMHGMNRISILLFLIAVIMMLYRWLSA